MWLTLVIRHWKNIVSVVSGIIVGFGIAWYIQDIKVDKCNDRFKKKESEIARLTNNLDVCYSANLSNVKTIKSLKNEIANATGLCNQRLKTKEATINRLKDIHNLFSTNIETGSSNEKKLDTSFDPLLDALRSMFDYPTGSSNKN